VFVILPNPEGAATFAFWYPPDVLVWPEGSAVKSFFVLGERRKMSATVRKWSK